MLAELLCRVCLARMENADARPESCVVSLPTGFARKSEITVQILQSFLQLNQPNPTKLPSYMTPQITCNIELVNSTCLHAELLNHMFPKKSTCPSIPHLSKSSVGVFFNKENVSYFMKAFFSHSLYLPFKSIQIKMNPRQVWL